MVHPIAHPKVIQIEGMDELAKSKITQNQSLIFKPSLANSPCFFIGSAGGLLKQRNLL